MFRHRPPLLPSADRGPLRVLFLLTSMPVGGAETLLAALVRRIDRERFTPEICCLKSRGPLGEELAQEVPVHAGLLATKWDVGVLLRLGRLMRQRRIDAVVTVGAGDKMFWGRLAAWWSRVPVVCCAIHSTGWPDSIGFLNRRLTKLTDAFIAVASRHAEFLVQTEGFPQAKVHTIPNGIDVSRFRPLPAARSALRQELGIPAAAPVVGIVAALRPEKNHRLFLESAAALRRMLPESQFLIVGDGPQRGELEELAKSLSLTSCTRFLGTRADIPELLSALDVFALTSHMEANPVSVLEALACGVPVVAPRVGSLPETVIPCETGYLFEPGDEAELTARLHMLLTNPSLGRQMGAAGRKFVAAHGSLESMVSGYEQLLIGIYDRKAMRRDLGVAVRESGAGARESGVIRRG